MVEIDILSECKHKYVVGLYETYYHENKLWVGCFCFFTSLIRIPTFCKDFGNKRPYSTIFLTFKKESFFQYISEMYRKRFNGNILKI